MNTEVNMRHKRLLFYTVLISIVMNAKAQIPNGGFENWNSFGSYMQPDGWATTNPVSAGSFYAVTRSTDHYPVSVGNYSVRIENNIALLGNYSGVGIIMLDTLAAPHPRFAISGHPTSLTGYYKFEPQGGDTMSIFIQLYKNGSSVSWGSFATFVAASAWTSFNIPLSVYSVADSAHISIAPWNADGPNYVPHGNSVVYIDNLSFDNLISSIPEQTSKNTLFSFYPNPASDIVTLNINRVNNDDLTLNIYNAIGTLVKSEILIKDNRQIKIGDLSNGIFLVTLKSKDFSGNQRLIIQR